MGKKSIPLKEVSLDRQKAILKLIKNEKKKFKKHTDICCYHDYKGWEESRFCISFQTDEIEFTYFELAYMEELGYFDLDVGIGRKDTIIFEILTDKF